MIQPSASARWRRTVDRKFRIASSSTANIKARIPDQGGVARLSVEFSMESSEISSSSSIQRLPRAGRAARCRKAYADRTRTCRKVGAVVPRVRVDNVLPTHGNHETRVCVIRQVQTPDRRPRRTPPDVAESPLNVGLSRHPPESRGGGDQGQNLVWKQRRGER